MQSYTTEGALLLVESLDVLVVNDDVEEACVVARLLRARFRVRIAVGLRDAVHALARQVPDVVICASEMPPYRGDALLAMIGTEHPHVRRVLMHRPLDADALLAEICNEE